MGSVRDPGRAAQRAQETARARLAARQTAARSRARAQRERALKGNPAARVDLAEDFAAVNESEARRARRR